MQLLDAALVGAADQVGQGGLAGAAFAVDGGVDAGMDALPVDAQEASGRLEAVLDVGVAIMFLNACAGVPAGVLPNLGGTGYESRVMMFVCAARGEPLTGVLREMAEVPDRPEFDGRVGGDGFRRAPATVPRGMFAREREAWGAPLVATDDPVAVFASGPCVGDPDGDGFLMSAGPENTIVVHPDDAPTLVDHPDTSVHVGCCGWHGREGMNRLCPCGALVGTEIGDCSTAFELHFDPEHVRETPV
ncbi:hypothetical protein [Embleya sp. NPDC059237]|uniref:hypothetical protein n=1 Tax=Embleya sp. NPDC059237 TaxID=3346784 RepID=UPI00367B8AE7